MNVEQGDTIAFPFGKFEVRELGDEVARAEVVSSDYIPEGETIPLRRESFGAREKEAESIDELVEKARDRAEPTYIVNEERRVEAFGMVMIEVTPVDKQHQVGGQIGRELAELGFQWVGAHTDHRGAPAASFSTQGEGKAEVTEVNEYGEGKMKPIEGGEDE